MGRIVMGGENGLEKGNNGDNHIRYTDMDV
jgi:hypothetical protein